MIISQSVLLRMINVSDKSRRKKPKHTLYVHNFFSDNHDIYDTMWKNVVQPGTPQMTI